MDPGRPPNPGFIFLGRPLKLAVSALEANLQEDKMEVRDEWAEFPLLKKSCFCFKEE